MPVSRKTIVLSDEPGVYHCISRCVRRAYLCGRDPLTNRNYEGRRRWICIKIKSLSKIFAVEIFAYSVLQNHYHIVLRVDPEILRSWTDEEVVRRWNRIYSVRKALTGESGDLNESIMEMALMKPEIIAIWRSRLGSVSWFMKQLNEPLARQANKEDGCKGRFWEGRFKCQRLTDEGAVLACMTYVDLNPIRAGMADTPEQSDFTSAQDRIVAMQSKAIQSSSTDFQVEKKDQNVKSVKEMSRRDKWLTPIDSIRVGREKRGWLLTLEEYLHVLDSTGRCIREGKRGSIPPDLAPILNRLNLNKENWLITTTCFGNRFYRISGRVNQMLAAARKAGQHWFQGLGFSKQAYQI